MNRAYFESSRFINDHTFCRFLTLLYDIKKVVFVDYENRYNEGDALIQYIIDAQKSDIALFVFGSRMLSIPSHPFIYHYITDNYANIELDINSTSQWVESIAFSNVEFIFYLKNEYLLNYSSPFSHNRKTTFIPSPKANLLEDLRSSNERIVKSAEKILQNGDGNDFRQGIRNSRRRPNSRYVLSRRRVFGSHWVRKRESHSVGCVPS